MKIPRTMSTQHPDNVKQPFFVNSSLIADDDEIKEAFYSFSHLKIREQLWDCEGKEVDNHVVEKLLSRYEDWFKKHRLGKDFFITLRGPNPKIEKNQGKVLIETLQSIPRNFDIAKHFYGDDIAPIFEIAQPMTSSADEMLRIKEYYKHHIIGKKDHLTHDVKISEWVGDFFPEDINIIPLIETKESMLDAHNIVKKYIEKAKIKDYQRVWLARSDPALNYGYLPAVLINKIALQRLHGLEEEISIDLPPIIGCGSVPFRGNFRPDKMENCLNAYPSVQTFTMQSAFKYDFPEDEVREAVNTLENSVRKNPLDIDEEASLEIIEKVSNEYQKQIIPLAPMINHFATFVPNRRKRKLHIGLFGYSRQNGGVSLPRAIKFCGALYSLGIPPEIFGLNALSEKEFDFVKESNKGFEEDIKDALRYYNEDNLKILPEELQKQVKNILANFDFETDESHKKITSIIYGEFKNNKPTLTENIERAAAIRNFLG